MKNSTGVKGEYLAQQYLKKHKYKIIAVNFKNKIGEIDIVCSGDNALVFVEVKTRSSLKFGYPREAVNAHKQNKIKLVATSYMQKYNLTSMPVRFDVIEILDNEITHITNAF